MISKGIYYSIYYILLLEALYLKFRGKFIAIIQYSHKNIQDYENIRTDVDSRKIGQKAYTFIALMLWKSLSVFVLLQIITFTTAEQHHLCTLPLYTSCRKDLLINLL